jgi:hypothetical protein
VSVRESTPAEHATDVVRPASPPSTHRSTVRRLALAVAATHKAGAASPARDRREATMFVTPRRPCP